MLYLGDEACTLKGFFGVDAPFLRGGEAFFFLFFLYAGLPVYFLCLVAVLFAFICQK